MARRKSQRYNGKLNVAPAGGTFNSPIAMNQKNGDIINPPRFIKGFSGNHPGEKARNDLNVKHVGK